MREIVALLLAFAVILTAPGPALPSAPARTPEYDLVIHNGRVMDPDTGLDAPGSNVGIRGKTIVAITREPIRGRAEINAAGRVVAPGFIDFLSYNPNGYGVWYKLADGVTTNLAMHGAAWDMGAWYRAYQRWQPPVHFGGALYYEAARTRIGVGRYRAASTAQLARLEVLAERSLRDGALGISMSPEYAPGTSTAEIVAMARLSARYNVPLSVHVRYADVEPPGTNLDALREVLDAARATGAAVDINHITSTGGTFSMPDSLQVLEAARRDGVDVTADAYPYPYWATYLDSARFDAGWQRRFHITYADLQLAGSRERLTSRTFRAYRRRGRIAVAYAISEADVVAALTSPLVMIASDAILEPGNNNHPRGAGTFTRTLRVYVRERPVLTLMEALRKMTIMPARRLEAQAPAMRRKGRLQVGADADIVIFDPARVGDRATVEQPNRFSAGMDYVLVAGRIVKDPTGFRRNVRAGEAIRSVFREARPADPIRVLINGQPVPAYALDGRILVDAGWPGRFGRSDVGVLRLTALRDQTNERPPSGDVPPALSGPALAREGTYAVRLAGEVVPAYALRGRVYIPVGRLSALGATVVWDQAGRAVRVTLPGR